MNKIYTILFLVLAPLSHLLYGATCLEEFQSWAAQTYPGVPLNPDKVYSYTSASVYNYSTSIMKLPVKPYVFDYEFIMQSRLPNGAPSYSTLLENALNGQFPSISSMPFQAVAVASARYTLLNNESNYRTCMANLDKVIPPSPKLEYTKQYQLFLQNPTSSALRDFCKNNFSSFAGPYTSAYAALKTKFNNIADLLNAAYGYTIAYL